MIPRSNWPPDQGEYISKRSVSGTVLARLYRHYRKESD